MPNWDEIKERVEANDNVITVTMANLREAAGKGKLGKNVCNKISKDLAGVGLGHIPQTLPVYQHELIRLYKRGTTIGEFIEMVIIPNEQNDRKLKEQLNEDAVDYVNIVEQIRELVSE